MVQIHNSFFFITSMVVPRGMAALVLWKWFVSRDIPTGAPSSNATIIPIPITLFPLLLYIHYRKLIRRFIDRAKSGVLVRASNPTILLSDIIRISSTKTRVRKALFRFVPVLHFLLLESKEDILFRIFLWCAPFTILWYSLIFTM